MHTPISWLANKDIDCYIHCKFWKKKHKTIPHWVPWNVSCYTAGVPDGMLPGSSFAALLVRCVSCAALQPLQRSQNTNGQLYGMVIASPLIILAMFYIVMLLIIEKIKSICFKKSVKMIWRNNDQSTAACCVCVFVAYMFSLATITCMQPERDLKISITKKHVGFD